MSHIAMVTIGAHGHVNPSLPVLTELVRRGHRVTVAVPAPFSATAASTGATPSSTGHCCPTRRAGNAGPTA